MSKKLSELKIEDNIPKIKTAERKEKVIVRTTSKKKTLDKVDYDTILELCNRVIMQLRGKAEKVLPEDRKFSNTYRIVEKAKNLRIKVQELLK